MQKLTKQLILVISFHTQKKSEDVETGIFPKASTINNITYLKQDVVSVRTPLIMREIQGKS